MQDLGVSITVDAPSIEAALARLRPYVSFDPAPLMEDIAALGESQTRRRLTDEKTAPDGTPWKPNWAGTPILTPTSQHLLKSLAFHASADEAVWGAAWEFAHVHQDGMVITPRFGQALKFWFVKGGFNGNAAQGGVEFVVAKSVTIPARPFIGISAENRTEIEDLVSDHFGRLR